MSTPIRILLAIVAVATLVVVGTWGYRSWREDRARARRVEELLSSAEHLLLANDHSEAAVQLREALEVDPENWRVHHRLGRVYLSLDRVGDAIEHLQVALERSPPEGIPLVQVDLGRAYSLRHASSGSPDDFTRSRMAYGSVSGDRQAEAKALEGLAMLWLSRGRSRGNRTDLEKARDSARELLDRYPDYEAVESVRGLAELLDGILEKQEPVPSEGSGSEDPPG